MPNEAFCHLEDGKKQVLLKSAIAEFSALPYEKVSIFKIAEKAGISRSGFYYYFKDKEDIYSYLLEEQKHIFLQELEGKGKKYDIFSFSKEIFKQLAKMKGTENEAFFKQVVANMKPDDTNVFLDQIEACTQRGKFIYLQGLETLNINSKQELMGLTCLLIGSTMYALQRYLASDESMSAAEERLEQMFDMIRYGVVKKLKGEG